jgi:DNA-binding NarL/FixJ family response regulator
MHKLLENDYEVVGVVSDGRSAITAVSELRPDVVLLDITMPMMNGIEAARRIKRECPDVKIVFVTMHARSEYIREAFSAGASGYVLKQSAVSELGQAIGEALQGRFFLTPSLVDSRHRGGFDPNENPANLYRRLTPRQREVLQLVAEGKSSKEIAFLLKISHKTVEFHRTAILEELGLRNTAELIRYAVEAGMVGA